VAWGITVPDSQGPIYGARTIYHPEWMRPSSPAKRPGTRARTKSKDEETVKLPFDFVYDRQDCQGGTPTQRQAMDEWMRELGLPGLAKMLAEHERQIEPPQDNLVFEKWGFIATCNAPARHQDYSYIGVAMRPLPDFQGAKWSGPAQIPSLETKVNINFNRIGSGTVIGYFREYDYLGLMVRVDNPPEFQVKQTGLKHPIAFVFGCDILPVPSDPKQE
jgi:hypothetical protein